MLSRLVQHVKQRGESDSEGLNRICSLTLGYGRLSYQGAGDNLVAVSQNCNSGGFFGHNRC